MSILRRPVRLILNLEEFRYLRCKTLECGIVEEQCGKWEDRWQLFLNAENHLQRAFGVSPKCEKIIFQTDPCYFKLLFPALRHHSLYFGRRRTGLRLRSSRCSVRRASTLI